MSVGKKTDVRWVGFHPLLCKAFPKDYSLPLVIVGAASPKKCYKVRLQIDDDGDAFFQIAIKNNIDVFYFACVVPIHVFFIEDGNMEKKVFLATWCQSYKTFSRHLT